MFRMVVVDVFVIRRRGVVATGEIESGRIGVGDAVLVNGGASVTVSAIEAYRKNIDTAEAGETVGLLLRDAEGAGIKAGDVLTATTVY